MATVGYARVSSEEQDTRLQRDALRQAGCVKLFEDKISSRKAERPRLAAALDYLRSGDELAVWNSIGSAARSRKSSPSPTSSMNAASDCGILTGTLAGTYTATGEGKFS